MFLKMLLRLRMRTRMQIIRKNNFMQNSLTVARFKLPNNQTVASLPSSESSKLQNLNAVYFKHF